MMNQSDKHELDSRESADDYTIIDSKKLRKQIITEKIYPFYIDEVNNQLMQIKLWSTLYTIFSTLIPVTMVATSILSFSVPQFPKITYLTYIAGIFSIIGLMCERFSHYCSTQHTMSTQRTNILLESIGIHDTLPDTLATQITDVANTLNPLKTTNQPTNKTNFPSTNSTNMSDLLNKTILPIQQLKSETLDQSNMLDTSDINY